MSGNTKVGVFGPAFSLAFDVVIENITAKIYNAQTYQYYRFGIYEKTGLVGDEYQNATLLAYTEEGHAVVYGSLVTLALTYPGPNLTLTKGEYLLCVHVSHSSRVYRGSNVGYDEYHNVADTYSDGLKTPFGAGDHNSDQSVTIYARYMRLPRPPTLIDQYFMAGISLIGLALMVGCPVYSLRLLRSGHIEDGLDTLGLLIGLFLLGLGLVIIGVW